MDIPKGEGLGKVLNTLLFSVMEGTLENRKEVLLAYAECLMQNRDMFGCGVN